MFHNFPELGPDAYAGLGYDPEPRKQLRRGGRMRGLPYIDRPSSVQVLDLLGDGTACLVWSSPLPGGPANMCLAAASRSAGEVTEQNDAE